MTTFFLIRHGDTDALGKTLSGRLPGVRLNAAGRAQVERLAERLAAERIDVIVTSPLERARETAGPLARRLGLEPRIAEELNEYDFGEWSGMSFRELEPDERWRRFNAFRAGARPPGGELMLEVQARAVGLVQRLCEERADGRVALVSHGDVIRAALLYYLGAPLDHFLRVEVSPASVSALEVGPYGPRVLFVNRTDS